MTTVNWRKILSTPGFWSRFFSNRMSFNRPDGTLDVKKEDAVWQAAFGRTPTQPPEAAAAEYGGETLSLPIGRYVWTITFEGGEDPAAVHRLGCAEWPKAIELGYNDPHFHLPILRWEELLKILPHVKNAPVEDRHVPLLLLAVTGVGQGEPLDPVRETTARWLEQSRLFTNDGASLLADALTWAWPLRWEYDEMIGHVNDGAHSHRNPDLTYWRHQDFERLREFMRAVGAE